MAAGIRQGGQGVVVVTVVNVVVPGSTTAVTFSNPRPVIFSAFAAASDRSSTRPFVNGPRSFTTTTTLRFDLGSVTRRRVPNGRLRCAAVNFAGSYLSPRAVRPE